MADLAGRVAALERLCAEPPAVLPAEELAHARELLRRSGHRLALGAGFTVVALAGGTGSGKSALFNTLVTLPLSPTGLRRPTTTEPVACVFGADDAGDLLAWLGVPPRQRKRRTSALDPDADRDLAGLVLVDLPDHDTVRTADRGVVDDVVAKADAVVWVTDPQKYADALGHERYLRPLRHHDAVLVVVVNRTDQLAPAAQPVLELDVRRLLRDDGIEAADLLLTSAATGAGVGRLRGILRERVDARRATEARIGADLDGLAERLRGVAGRPPAADVRVSAYGGLVDRVFAAVGGPALAAAAAAGEPRAAAVDPLVVDRLIQECAERVAGGLSAAGRAAVLAAADREAERAPARLRAALAAVDQRAVAALRPRRRLFGSRARRRAEFEQAVAEALRSALGDALAPVRTALDHALRPWWEIAAASDAIGPPVGRTPSD